MVRAVYNILTVFVFMLSVFVYGVITDLFVRDESKKLKKRVGFLHRITKIGTKMVGIKVNTDKQLNIDNPHFIVSNHLSYLDIIIIASLHKTVFISTTEVGSTGFFGKLASYGGAVFIDRKNRLKVKEDLENIKKILQQDINVVIFLEGTTSNGDGVLPFKSSFLEVVFHTKKPVSGLCIKYKNFNSKPIDQSIRELIYYYGDHQLVSHMFRFLLNLRRLEVEVRDAGVFFTDHYPSRKEMAAEIHQKISNLYRL